MTCGRIDRERIVMLSLTLFALRRIRAHTEIVMMATSRSGLAPKPYSQVYLRRLYGHY